MKRFGAPPRGDRRASSRANAPRHHDAEETRVLPGPRFVLEALRGPHARRIRAVYVEDERKADAEGIVSAARAADVRVHVRSREDLDGMAAGVRHQGVVGVALPFPYVTMDELLALAPDAPLFVALDEISDPHNFGAIVRSAIAFGAHGIIVPEHRSAPVSSVVVRASAGASERAQIARVTNLQRTLLDLSDRGLQIVGLDTGGTVSVATLPPAASGRVLVIGSEGEGLRRLVRERCTLIASIPQTEGVESLNASVAAGIALYEACKQRN